MSEMADSLLDRMKDIGTYPGIDYDLNMQNLNVQTIAMFPACFERKVNNQLNELERKLGLR